MRSTFWKIKNSYAAKARADQEAKERIMKLTRQEDSRSSNRQQSLISSTIQEKPVEIPIPEVFLEARESNFEQLKKEIRYLENSQVMSMKYRTQTEPDEPQPAYLFKSTGKEFYPSKKVAHFQKFKLCLKKKGRSKRLSMLLEGNQRNNILNDYNCLESLKVKDLNLQAQGQVRLKKKETPYIIKKFYRPNSSNRSMQELSMQSTQIRGRKLRTSVTNRKDKENVLICCY